MNNKQLIAIPIFLGLFACGSLGNCHKSQIEVDTLIFQNEVQSSSSQLWTKVQQIAFPQNRDKVNNVSDLLLEQPYPPQSEIQMPIINMGSQQVLRAEDVIIEMQRRMAQNTVDNPSIVPIMRNRGRQQQYGQS